MTESTTIATPAPDERAFTESVQILQQHIDEKAYPQAIAKYNECQQKYGADGNPTHHEALSRLSPLLNQLKYLHIEEELKVALDKCWHFITKKWASLAQGHLTQAKDHLLQLHDLSDTPQIGKYQKRITRYERYVHTLNKLIRAPETSTPAPVIPIEDQKKGSFHTDLIAHQYHSLSFKFSDSPYLQVILPTVGGIYYRYVPSPRTELAQGVISVIILSKKTPLNIPDRETFITVRHQILATEALTDLFTAGFPNITLLPNLRARIGHTLFEVDLTFVHLQEEYPEIIFNNDIWECPISEFAHFLQYLEARYDAYHQVKFEYFKHQHYFLLRARSLSRIAYTSIGLSAYLVGLAVLEGLAIPFSPFWYGIPVLPLGFMLGTGLWHRHKNQQLDHILHLLHPMTMPVEIKKDLIHLISAEYREFLDLEYGELSNLPTLPKDAVPLTDPSLPPTETPKSPKKGRFILHSLTIPRPNFRYVKQTFRKFYQWVRSIIRKMQFKKKVHALTQGIRKVTQKIRSFFARIGQKISQRIRRLHQMHQKPPKSAMKQEITDYFST